MHVVGGMGERPVFDKQAEERIRKVEPTEHVEVRLDEGVFVKLDEGLYVRKTKDGTIEFYEEEQ
jgi:prefoldin subunit 5